jgi:hypothetical protein
VFLPEGARYLKPLQILHHDDIQDHKIGLCIQHLATPSSPLTAVSTSRFSPSSAIRTA